MTMAAAKQNAVLGLLLLLLTSVDGFGPSAGPSAATRSLRPSSLSKSCPFLRHARLFAEPSPPELSDGVAVVDDVSPKSTSAYDDGDPRQALEQFGSLFSQMQVIVTEGNTWDSEELEDKTREFVRSYVGIFVPSIGYVATSVGVYLATFAVVRLGLALSGRGYADILTGVGGIPPLRDLLERADPAWGNTAIALVVLELLSPLILGATLALTPKTMDALRENLDGWGWGEEGINDRVTELLGK